MTSRSTAAGAAGRRRWFALGGVAGPVAFIGAWVIAGSRAKGYSSVDDPISRLAAVGASTRPLMTAGLLVYAAGLAGYAAAATDRPEAGAPWAAAVNALATAGVAATPLDGALGGNPHGFFAVTGYAALAATAATAAVRSRGSGPPARAAVAGAVSAAVAACLAVSVVTDTNTGFWQRTGLTIGDVWLIATSSRLLSRRTVT